MASPIPDDAERWSTEHGPIVLFRDGSAWLAVRPDFTNIQESPTGTGNTPQSALQHLLAEERRVAGQ